MPLSAGIEKNSVFFKQPSGFFGVFWGFWGFFGVFWVFWFFLYICSEENVFRFFFHNQEYFWVHPEFKL
jgi:hypothetical protein